MSDKASGPDFKTTIASLFVLLSLSAFVFRVFFSGAHEKDDSGLTYILGFWALGMVVYFVFRGIPIVRWLSSTPQEVSHERKQMSKDAREKAKANENTKSQPEQRESNI